MLSANRTPFVARPAPARNGPVPLRLQGRLLVVGATLLLCLPLGCKSDNKAPPPPVDELRQSGATPLPPDAEMDVYYPVPYISPPSLIIESRHCEVTLQANDHFRVRTHHYFRGTLFWKARGVRLIVATPPPVPYVAPVPWLSRRRRAP